VSKKFRLAVFLALADMLYVFWLTLGLGSGLSPRSVFEAFACSRPLPFYSLMHRCLYMERSP
jgi:hypothetical protein